MLLTMSFSSFCIQSKSGLNRECGLPGISILQPALYVVHIHALNWAEFPCIAVYQSPISCAIANTDCKWAAKTSRPTHCMYLFSSYTCSIALSDLTCATQDKIIRNVKIVTAEHSTKHGALLSTGPCNCPAHIPMMLASHICVENTSKVILHF